MDNKKKITIAVVAVAIVMAIAIIVFLLTKNTNTVYTISFNTDGGNEVVSQQVEEGEIVTKPADPSKEGYEFLGWYLNGKYFDFQTKVEGNLTLDAKWKEVIKGEVTPDIDDEEKEDEVTKYTVTFNSDGGTTVAKQTIEEGKKATEPKAPTKKGYTFKGWYLGSTKYNFSNKVTKDITLKAKWDKVEEKEEQPVVKTYTVTFDANGGTSVAKQTVEEGKTATSKKTTRTGYTFKGWYLNGEPFDFSTPITSNITLKAEWEKILKEYTVTFNTDGGSPVKSQTVKENETVTKPNNPTKDGYTFKGWLLDGKEYNFSNKVTKDIALTAKWEKEEDDEPVVEVTKYTVEFKVDGTVVKTLEVEESKKISSLPTTPTKAGYTFKGWYCNGNKVTTDTVVSKNITVEGKWDVYTFKIELIDGDQYSPNRKVVAYKNGTAIGITAIYGNYNGKSEYMLGKWNENLGAVKIVSYEQFKAASNYKVKLNDGTMVYASN